MLEATRQGVFAEKCHASNLNLDFIPIGGATNDSSKFRKNMTTRYYSPDDLETYVTPSRLKRLGQKSQIAYMTHWFHSMFEDPQQQTPYAIDKESPYNYEYIWGGPYYAEDVLHDEFGGIVSEDVIEKAINEVEKDGITEWAPGAEHPDIKQRDEEAKQEQYDQPLPTLKDIQQRLKNRNIPSFGDHLEQQDRNLLQRSLADLRNNLDQNLPAHGGIGHNQCPEQFTLINQIKIEITNTINTMDTELEKDTPDVTVMVESTERLQKIFHWINGKIDRATNVFVDKIIATSTVAVGAELVGLPVYENLETTISAT
ncbi:MAG: hypothetical protein OXE94_11475 [Aestuariivita sp.]|nr:hypothetical protein [Aestuariivita sp.]MCY4201902.1 hypothetical protein [Aestuariivita sp.]